MMGLSRCLAVVVLCAQFGCGGGTQENTSELSRVPSTEGILYLDPNSHELVTGGVLMYRIYATGDIFYFGDVSYFGAPGTIGEVQVPFNGRFKVTEQDVASTSYSTRNNTHLIQKISAKVLDADGEQKISKVLVRVVDPVGSDSGDAQGHIHLDTSENTIKIKAADIVGTLFEGTRAQVRIRLKLTQEKL